VKTDTTAKLAFVGLTGVTQIQLTGGSLSSRLLKETVGKGERATILASESAFAKLLSSSEDITATASDVLVRLNRMLSDENTRHISATLANLDQVTDTLAAERGEIAALIRDARSSAAKLDQLMARADGAVGKLDGSLTALDRDLPRILRNLDRTLVQLEGLSRNANGLVSDNREAIDQFAQQGLGQLGPTLTELRSLLRQLNRVAARVEDSPSNAILGGPAREEFKP
jgi:phospholipid/cholesterol/gamma-HCH transport system substrate-binding protein